MFYNVYFVVNCFIEKFIIRVWMFSLVRTLICNVL